MAVFAGTRTRRPAQLIGISGAAVRAAIVANGDYVGDGHGIPTPGMLEAVTLLARTEGILLDPVYSSKGMAGLIDLIRIGHIRKGQNVVFLPTGDAVGLYGDLHAFGEKRSD